MERRLIHYLSGIGLAALLSSCGSKDTVISPILNNAAGSVAAVGTSATDLAGDTASRLANETSSPSAPEPFSLRDGEQIVNHTVTSGDTLSGLSKKYGTRISRIQAANNMTGTTIFAGKSLKIPTSESAVAAMSADPTPERSAPIPPVVAPAPAPAIVDPVPAPAPSGFASGFGNPALNEEPPSAPVPAPAIVSPVAPEPVPAPAVPAPSGLPSFNSGLRIED